MGSIPLGDSDFFLFPTLVTNEHIIFINSFVICLVANEWACQWEIIPGIFSIRETGISKQLPVC